MTSRTIHPSIRTARLAGLLYLILIPIGFFGVAYVPEVLMVPDDTPATVRNIVASESLVRLSMVSLFLMNIISIAKALLLYDLLKPIGQRTATFMAIFLLFGAGISLLNEVNHFAVLFLSRAHTVTALTAAQSNDLVQLFLDMRIYGNYIATIFWGIWLFPLGYLIVKLNTVLTKIIGVLLIAAGIGYVIDSLMLFLVPQYLIPLNQYIFIGELLFALWLLFKGTTVELQKRPALEFA